MSERIAKDKTNKPRGREPASSRPIVHGFHDARLNTELRQGPDTLGSRRGIAGFTAGFPTFVVGDFAGYEKCWCRRFRAAAPPNVPKCLLFRVLGYGIQANAR